MQIAKSIKKLTIATAVEQQSETKNTAMHAGVNYCGEWSQIGKYSTCMRNNCTRLKQERVCGETLHSWGSCVCVSARFVDPTPPINDSFFADPDKNLCSLYTTAQNSDIISYPESRFNTIIHE